MKQQNLALKKLKGIKPKGVKPRPSSKLEKLIEARNRAMDDYCFKGGLFFNDPFQKKYYISCLQQKAPSYYSGIEYSLNHLEEFMHSVIEEELNYAQSFVQGLFTGCLLSSLTRVNTYCYNKRTFVYFNSQGKDFKFPFHYATDVDVLVVENRSGLENINFIGDDNTHAFMHNFCSRKVGTQPLFSKAVVKPGEYETQVLTFLKSISRSNVDYVDVYSYYKNSKN